MTSTKNLVWDFMQTQDKLSPCRPCEARNSSGTVTAQYFSLGETLNGTTYFYTRDHLGLSQWLIGRSIEVSLKNLPMPLSWTKLASDWYLQVNGSIREMTSTSGAVQAQYLYDPFGRTVKLQGTAAADFQYAGYYEHEPSGLNLAVYRLYSPNLGRWLNRDPNEEVGGINLFGYVNNQPIEEIDPFGLQIAGPDRSMDDLNSYAPWYYGKHFCRVNTNPFWKHPNWMLTPVYGPMGPNSGPDNPPPPVDYPFTPPGWPSAPDYGGGGGYAPNLG
jgi:RHS repeat-associated protein